MLSRAVFQASRINGTARVSAAIRPAVIPVFTRYASSKPPARGPAPYKNVKKPVQPVPLSAKATPAAAAGAAASTKSNVEGKRVPDPIDALKQSSRPAAQEPIAQQADIDSPPVGGIRETAQSQQATAENTVPPPDQANAEQAQPEAPQKPLPDLRQGIPSTFEFEFGQGKQSASAGKDGAPDITDADAGASGRRGAEEDEDFSRADYQTSIDKRRAQVTRYMYLAVAAGLALGGAYFTRPFARAEETPSGFEPADASGWEPGKMYRRLRARISDRLGYYTEPSFPQLLPTVPEGQRAPYTLVLSLEDLMVHSTWDRTHGYRMAKRPGIDYFIRYLSPYYELVLFTTVPLGVADPVIKKLDPYHFIMWPLGREATKYDKGDLVKDLSYLNRDLKKTLIIDTVPGHVKQQPENAIVLPKWNGDPKDPHTNDLVALIPFLEYIATMNVGDVRDVIRSFEGKHIPTEFARREAIAREQFNKQLAEQKAKAPKRSLGTLFGGLGIKADRAGGMILGDGQSVAEGLAQGKMLSDQIREQGQRQYEYLEKQIREQGAQWLKDEEEEQKRMMEEQMKEIKKNPIGSLGRFFGGAPPDSKA